MITTYIELTLKSDNTRHLIPIEDLKAIGEAKKIEEIIENGQAVKREVIICRVLVGGASWFVEESYNDIKTEINKIANALIKHGQKV